jgi:peptidoglycan/LPS O-acetylase OafA/YrhL
VVASRDNNFNLLRFSAATGVFISHTFLLSGIGFKPAAAVLGYISVNVFFIISGFLVTKSLIYRGNITKFVLARVLRIYPALIVAVLFSTFVVGIAFTELPIHKYLVNEHTYDYVFKNILLVLPGRPETLPGVFISSPNSSIVNAPLWTLPYEIKMYILLGLLGSLLIYKPLKIKKKLFIYLFLLLTTISMGLFIARYTLRADPISFGFKYDYFRFMAMFGSGVLLFMFRDRVNIAIISASTLYRPLFVGITYSSLCYLVIYLAYVPKGFIRKFNNLGDYSYGIYIYGYPIQQSVEQMLPNLHIIVNFIVTYSFTLLFSILSWHLIEKRILRYKKQVITH